MKIIDIEVLPVDLGRQPPAIVKIITDEDIFGIGESFGGPSAFALSDIIERGLKPILIDEDPFNIQKILFKLSRRILHVGMRGLNKHAISGIEIALWDILGKAKGVPIYQMLGGLYNDKIRAYCSPPSRGDPEDLVRVALEHVQMGFTGLKFHRVDTEWVEPVREAVGENIDLFVDAAARWNKSEAIQMANKFEKVGVGFVEQPLWPVDDYESLRKVTAAVNIPIAASEDEDSVHGYKEMITKEAVDIIQPQITKVGGILEAKKICTIADVWNVQVAPHGYTYPIALAASIQLDATLPNFYLQECIPRMVTSVQNDILIEPIKFENGCFIPPKGPGLGVELNEEGLKKYIVESYS
jgi:L-alanine-DL-glutamate epimerase-like enolase superfamily enzyme